MTPPDLLTVPCFRFHAINDDMIYLYDDMISSQKTGSHFLQMSRIGRSEPGCKFYYQCAPADGNH